MAWQGIYHRSELGKLSSERHLAPWNILSCTCTRQPSCVLFTVIMLFRRYVIISCKQESIFLLDNCQTVNSFVIVETLRIVYNVICNLKQLHYSVVCILIEMKCYYRASYLIFWLSYAHKIRYTQASSVITLPVQAIQYIHGFTCHSIWRFA